MIIKRSINFDLENRKNKGNLISDNVPIRIRLSYSSNRIELSTGIRIDRNKWDDSKKKVKNNCTNKLKLEKPLKLTTHFRMKLTTCFGAN